jgi:hypothetical protein
LIPAIEGLMHHALGFSKEFDQKKYSDALEEMMVVAIELDQHLKHQQEGNLMEWVVYN